MIDNIVISSLCKQITNLCASVSQISEDIEALGSTNEELANAYQDVRLSNLESIQLLVLNMTALVTAEESLAAENEEPIFMPENTETGE